jgi:1,2-diacylglycerol 3-beta-glucosyltransferase
MPFSKIKSRQWSSCLPGFILLCLQVGLAISTVYLLGLLLAARDAVRNPQSVEAAGDDGDEPLRLVVLVPAYNEEDGLRETLESLAACNYPSAARRTVVVADNCTDRTADIARAAGVEVWERADSEQRGKGFAVAWALERLFAGEDFDAVVMVDADCTASTNLLGAIEGRLRGGADAIQVDYVAGNPEASHVSALRFGAFALADTVRFLGKQRLGLSCGLVGTGMAFTREVLRDAPWNTTGLVEDGEYHMRLVLAGVRAEFGPEAWVSQAVPTSLKASTDQQARWEKGRLELIRRWSPGLISAGLAKRDVVKLHAGLECLVPPQSVIAMGGAGGAVAAAALGRRRLLGLSFAVLVAQAAFVLGGLRLVRAPASVYRALLMAPVLIATKLALYGRLLVGRGPSAWVRTEREGPS